MASIQGQKALVRRDGVILAYFEYCYQAEAFAKALSKTGPGTITVAWTSEGHALGIPTSNWLGGKGLDRDGKPVRASF